MKWQAQHQLLKFLDPPYVYNVLIDDPGAFVDAIQGALSHPIERWVRCVFYCCVLSGVPHLVTFLSRWRPRQSQRGSITSWRLTGRARPLSCWQPVWKVERDRWVWLPLYPVVTHLDKSNLYLSDIYCLILLDACNHWHQIECHEEGMSCPVNGHLCMEDNQ